MHTGQRRGQRRGNEGGGGATKKQETQATSRDLATPKQTVFEGGKGGGGGGEGWYALASLHWERHELGAAQGT